MSEDPRLGLLGIALKGGRLSIGRDRVREALHRGRARLIVLAEDAGEALRREVSTMTASSGVPWVDGPASEEMGRSLGRTRVSVAAVTDDGLAEALMRKSVRRQV
jgi:ribosomal protein L7Ae-like RNA K-turn-binding protein